MGLAERVRRLEDLAGGDWCAHQPVRILDPLGEPPRPVVRCWCGRPALCVQIEYTVGAAPWETPL